MGGGGERENERERKLFMIAYVYVCIVYDEYLSCVTEVCLCLYYYGFLLQKRVRVMCYGSVHVSIVLCYRSVYVSMWFIIVYDRWSYRG